MKQNIKLFAAFIGLKFLPRQLGIGHNSINPKLILYDDKIEYRSLIFTQKLNYSDIEKVDVFLAWKTTNICISKKNSIFTFAGNLNNKQSLTELVIFFNSKKCNLTSKALELINGKRDS